MNQANLSSVETEEKSKNYRYYYDYSLVAILILLMAFGLIMLYSISSYTAVLEGNDDMYYFKRQLGFSIFGFFVMLIVSKFKYHLFGAYSKNLYWVSMVAMFLVLTPLGIEAGGARRWIKIPIIGQFQPSEITKVAVILFVPFMICQMGKYINKRENWMRVLVTGVIASGGVFVFTDNLSTAVIVFGIVIGIMWIVLPQARQIVAAMIVALLAGYFFLIKWGVEILENMDGFRGERILVWLAPENYASDGGYQVLQGLYAIGSGGFFGKGLGNGTQKLTAIPEVQNDYIIAAIIEELGIFGAGIILLLFAILLYRLFYIATNAPDMYGSLIVAGIFIHISLQVILNIAVVTAMIPNTGITLPFISYGGTAILFLLIEMGIALSVSSRIKIVM